MNLTLAFDITFTHAADTWRALIAGEALLSIELVGAADAVMPEALIAETPGGRIVYNISRTLWPEEIGAMDIVWDHFLKQYGLDEMRSYCRLHPDTSEMEVRRALLDTAWWRSFEELVNRAIAYEWRAAAQSIAPGVPMAVCRPERDTAPLSEFEQRLILAAIAFEASSFDLHLLYSGSARVASLLMQMGQG